MTSLVRQFATALAAAWFLMPSAAAFADEAGDQYAVAAGHYAARRWELAAEEFQSLLDRFPEHSKKTKARFFCAEALVQSGKYDEAQRHFAAVIADEQARSADAGQAAATYGRQALFRAGECAFWANHPDQAQASLAEFRERYADDPLNAYVLRYLGELALQAGDAAKARRFYRDGLDQYPDGPTAIDCRLGLVQAELQLNEPAKAQEILAPLLNREDQAVVAYYWLGQIYKSQQQWARAADAFQTALAADPEHAGGDTLRYHAAESLLRAERFQAAIDLLHGKKQTEGASSLPADHAYLVALAQQGLGQHDDALATLNGLTVAADDKNSEAARNIDLAKATSLLALGLHREAIEPLDRYLAAPGDHDAEGRARALAQLALCHARVQDFAMAQARLDQLKNIGSDTTLANTTRLQLAEIALDGKETARATQWLQAAANDSSPADVAASALLALGRLAIETGDLEKGISSFEQLLERFPDAPQAVDAALACAGARERLEQYDAALAMYQLVIEKHADADRLPEALFQAASICDRLSQDTQALELYGRLIDEFADSELAPAGVYGAAWCLQDLDRRRESQEKFDELRRKFPESKYWLDATYRLALAAAQSKQFDRATELLDELIASQARPPISAELIQHALYLRAQVAVTRRTWDAAKRDLDRLMVEHRTCALALPAEYLRADIAYRRGDYDEAGQRFAELAPKVKGHQEPWVPMVSLRRAQVLGQAKRWSEARAVAAAIAEEFPNFDQQYEADYLIGRALTAEADLAQAREWYQKVVRSPVAGKTETAAMAQWMIGETYFLQEQYAAAIREYLRVEVLYAFPHWQAAALLQAGKCYEHTGEWKNAGDVYGRLVARYSQTEFVAEARQRLAAVQSRTASRAKRP